MRIAVDATCWHNGRGYGRHARALLTALARSDARNRYTFFLDAPAPQGSLPDEAEVRLVPTGTPAAAAAASSGRRSLRDMWQMSRALADPSFDVLLFPTVYSYVPVLSRARKVVVIHDVIPEAFPRLTLPSRTGRLFWKAKSALGRRQAAAVVTVSEYSRNLIVERFRIDPRRVYVVGEAGDPVFRVVETTADEPRLTAYGLGGPARDLVYVGGFGPHKNLSMLLRVFASLAAQPRFADVRLVLVGEYRREVFHSDFAALEQQVRDLRLDDRVVFPGFVPDDDLVLLLNRATALVLPSLMEGFGLPAIEAAACGCPVIATTESPLPALLGDGGRYVDPHDPAQLRLALEEVLSSAPCRAAMRTAGLAAAGRLTWEDAARQMMIVLQQVAGQDEP